MENLIDIIYLKNVSQNKTSVTEVTNKVTAYLTN